MFVRVLIFLLGLSVLSFGISTVTQAQLGTGSVSSLAYVLTLFTGISMGIYVFLTNLFFYFVGLACVPTKWFKKALMQLPTCFLFGPASTSPCRLRRFSRPSTMRSRSSWP